MVLFACTSRIRLKTAHLCAIEAQASGSLWWHKEGPVQNCDHYNIKEVKKKCESSSPRVLLPGMAQTMDFYTDMADKIRKSLITSLSISTFVKRP